MVQIYIVGTHHSFQTCEKVTNEDVLAFKTFLKENCQRYGITAIAEEMSHDALADACRNESNCKKVADELCLAHRYCDPDKSTRMELGIRQENEVRVDGFSRDLPEGKILENIRREYRKREIIWLEEIKKLNNYPLLFVCGANHTRSFSELAVNSGFSCQVIAEDWSPNFR